MIYRLVTLAALLIMLVPSSSFAGESADFECVGAAPNALLVPDSYAEQRFVRGQHNQATESALLDDSSTRLTINYLGCADSIEQKFTFTVAPTTTQHNAAYWASFAREKITDLKVNKDNAWFVPKIIEFLASIPKQALKQQQFSVCKDGSVPDIDGCVFETGGGYFFELQQNGAKLKVIAGQYSIL